jgi:hypothetical protein
MTYPPREVALVPSKSGNEELRRFRSEAQRVLELKKK